MSSPSKSNKDRLQYAFDIAEKELGIAKLLDPEDVDVARHLCCDELLLLLHSKILEVEI